jgi:polyhydroxyalkanoate synthesis regulator phasin
MPAAVIHSRRIGEDAMATNPWASDLDRLKRELLQKMERTAADAQNAAARNNQNSDLTRRLDALERRVQTTVDQTNRTFSSAHTSDTQMTTRITQLERRLQTTIDQINRTVTDAHSADTQMGSRLDQLERRVADLARAAERSR